MFGQQQLVRVGFTDGIKVGFGRIPSFEKFVHDVHHDLRSGLLPSSTRLDLPGEEVFLSLRKTTVLHILAWC